MNSSNQAAAHNLPATHWEKGVVNILGAKEVHA
jgi:hypothetical protein